MTTIFKNQGGGPWGGGGGSDDNGSNPWSGKPSGGKRNNNNDIDDMIDKFQGRLKKMMSGGGGKSPNPSKPIMFLAGIALALWLFTGFYRIEEGELGVVLRFGEMVRIDDPGLRYRIPAPVEEVIIRNVAETRIISSGQEGGRGTEVTNEQRLMLTGDENIVQTNYTILWKIKDIAKYLFVARDPDSTVSIAAESALREIVAQTTARNAIAEGRGEIEQKTQDLLQKILDSIDMGVMIVKVQLQNVQPPSEVIPAYNDVQASNVDRERLILEAHAYRDDIIPRARGLVMKISEDANADSQREIAEAEGIAEKMDLIRKSYQGNEEVTLMRARLQAMDAVTKDSKITIIDRKLGAVLPHFAVNKKTNKEGQ